MTFSEYLNDYVNAQITSNIHAGELLPLRSTASQRARRMRPEDRALDWRLQVQEQCGEVRRTIAPDAEMSPGILKTEIEALLRLLGEIDD
jgi:hypothetical protein